jgi:hypothetical protein
MRIKYRGGNLKSSFSQLKPEIQDEVILYVGEEMFQKSYQKRWASMEIRSSKLSWNWATFFFQTIWAAYRRMYVWAYVYLTIEVLVNLILLFGFKKTGYPMFLDVISLVVNIVLWIFANYLYQQHAIKTTEKLRVQYPDKEKRHAYLKRIGGGSAGSAWLYILIVVLCAIGYVCLQNMMGS